MKCKLAGERTETKQDPMYDKDDVITVCVYDVLSHRVQLSVVDLL